MSPDLIRFGMGFEAPRATAQNALGVFSAVQHLSPTQQVAAITAAFVVLAERLGDRRHELAVKAEKLLHDADIAREVSAIRQYIEEEIIKNG